MMITSNSLKVRLFMEPVDMRKSFNGLGGLLRNVHNGEVNPQYLYVFANKRKNRFEALLLRPLGSLGCSQATGGGNL